MISYAIDHEDVVAARAFSGRTEGIYADLDSDEGRATRHLHGIGWRGFSTMNDLALAARLAEERPGDVVCSSLELAEPLRDLLAVHGLLPLDFVRVGLRCPEGLAAEAVALAPVLLVVEELTHRPSLAATLSEAGYLEGGFDGVNHYFARRGEEELQALLYPACSRDGYVAASLAELSDERDELRSQLSLMRATTGARRFAARHEPPVAKVIELDRVAVVDVVGSGGSALAPLLAEALGYPLFAVEHPADLDWPELDERLVITLAHPYSEHLRVLLASNGFRVITLARHPFESLLELRSMRAVATSSAFVDWATSPEVVERVGANARWLIEPGTLRVDQDELAADPYAVVVSLLQDLGIGTESTPAWARGLGVEVERARSVLSARFDWRSELEDEPLSLLVEAYRLTFERLAIDMPVVGDRASIRAES